MTSPTNNVKFNVKNGLAVGASGFEVINTSAEWVGASGPGQSPYGATGSNGYDGDQGATGVDGATGSQGIVGDQGGNGGGDGGYRAAGLNDTYPSVTYSAPVDSTTLVFNSTSVGSEFGFADGFNTINSITNSGANWWEYGFLSYQQNTGGDVINGVAQASSWSPDQTSASWVSLVDSLIGAAGAPYNDDYWTTQDSYGTTLSFNSVYIPDGAVAVIHAAVENNNPYGGQITSIVASDPGITFIKRSSRYSTGITNGDASDQNAETWYAINNSGNGISTSVTINYDNNMDDGIAFLSTWLNVNLSSPWSGGGGGGGINTGYAGATGPTGEQGATGANPVRNAISATIYGTDWESLFWVDSSDPSNYTGVHHIAYNQADAVSSTLNQLLPGDTIILNWTDYGWWVPVTLTVVAAPSNDSPYKNRKVQVNVGPQSALNPANFIYSNASGDNIVISAPEISTRGYAGATGPTGEQGQQGPQGDQGVIGQTGVQGLTGPDGQQGVDGASGIDGASGPTGEIGATGPAGARYHATSTTTLNLTTGATGAVLIEDQLIYSTGQTILITDGGGKHIHATVDSYDQNTKILAFTPIDHVGTGSASSWEINLDGAEGPAGATGATGYDGATGPTGTTGAEGIQGASGATGIDGASGTIGLDGATGIDGASGATGATGPDGEQGSQGPDGDEGIRGETGQDGAQGYDGEPGYTGATGASGVDGATGAQGTDGSYLDVAWDDSYGHIGANQTVDNSIVAILDNGGPVIHGANGSSQESAMTISAARISASQHSKAMFSIFQSGSTGGVTPFIGIADDAINSASYLGSDNHSFGFDKDGNVYFNGSVVDTGLPTFGFADKIDVAIDYNAPKYWIRKNGGSWNGDPAAGTGGKTLFIPVQNYFQPAVTTHGQTSFNILITPPYDVPSGFTFLGGSLATNGGATGPDGATGVTGPEGNQGYDGASGVTGQDGATGPQGNQGVTGDTGQTGQDGATGTQGPTGPDGQQGIIGYDAATGPTGIDGEQGQDGATGVQGASGITGATGVDGATGYHGLQFKATANGNFSVSPIGTAITIPFLTDPNTGNNEYNYSIGQSVIIAQDIDNYMVADITAVYGAGTGNTIDVVVTKSVGTATGISGWIVNLDGAVGQIGASGVTGQDGATGADGQQGTTGTDGEQGVVGLDGATGVTGATGPEGIQGEVGYTGVDGASGPTGQDGATGIQGASGATGPDGDIGITGLQGYSLYSGATGISGTSQTTVDMFAANEVGTAKYIVQGVEGSNVQATEVILTQNSSGVWMTEYATLKTNTKVFDVTATSNGSVVSLKVTPTNSGTTISWVRESVTGRIGGTTVHDVDGTHTFYSRSNADNGAIPVGKAYVYPNSYWIGLINFTSLIGTSVTFDDAGVGPQSPAIGTIDSWDGGTLVVTITSGNFTSRNSLDKITYGY